MGKDEKEELVVDDLREINNILIAGATGTGKSMLLHSIISTILCTTLPDRLKLVLVDYKMVELSMYNGIPHLLIPVITDVKKSISVLVWIVQEMNKRYYIFSQKGVKDIYEYNQNEYEEKIPEILIIIDDILEIIRFSQVEVTSILEQLFSKSKNAGIYIIISSQSAAKTIIPESIKSNILNRISFKVVSSKESIAVLDEKGAEKITETGTMLYKKYNSSQVKRIEGINIEIGKIQNIIADILKNNSPRYNINVLESLDNIYEDEEEDDTDELLIEVIDMAVDFGEVSTSDIQRRFKIGYTRAGRIIDQMEERGIISEYKGSQPREVLINNGEWRRIKELL